MKTLKQVLISKQAKRFYWNTINGAIGILIVYLMQLNWAYAPLFVAVLNGITKEINNKYIK